MVFAPEMGPARGLDWLNGVDLSTRAIVFSRLNCQKEIREVGIAAFTKKTFAGAGTLTVVLVIFFSFRNVFRFAHHLFLIRLRNRAAL